MKLVYAKLEPGNFGDELNPYLWPRLFPKAFAREDDCDFLGIGTILSPFVDRKGHRKVVFGAGAGYWDAPVLDSSWTVYFVRGPLTAAMLGLPEGRAITDGAYCLSFLRKPSPRAGNDVVFMPHHKSEFEVDWKGLCAELGWVYASPTVAVEAGLELLGSARLVVTEAMHGAIVADIYRVPWVPVRYGFRSLDKKWDDWCSSVSVLYRPIDLPALLDVQLSGRETMERMGKKVLGQLNLGKPAWRATPVFRSGRKARERALELLRRIPDSGETFLSADSAFETIKQRLWEQIERFRSEHER